MRFIDLRKLRKLLDAVDRQLSAFDVAEEEPEDKLAKQEFERQSPALGFFSGIFFEPLRRGGVWGRKIFGVAVKPPDRVIFGWFSAVWSVLGCLVTVILVFTKVVVVGLVKYQLRFCVATPKPL